jgi:hypothetical protein
MQLADRGFAGRRGIQRRDEFHKKLLEIAAPAREILEIQRLTRQEIIALRSLDARELSFRSLRETKSLERACSRGVGLVFPPRKSEKKSRNKKNQDHADDRAPKVLSGDAALFSQPVMHPLEGRELLGDVG